jgi:hypothetical protein
MNKAQLQNLVIFMNRVQVTGQEAFAWAETFAAVQQELADLNAPPASTAVAGLPLSVAPGAPPAIRPNTAVNMAANKVFA